jgi:hypothetical protein
MEFDKRRKQRRGLTEAQALAIAARARRDDTSRPASAPSSTAGSPATPLLICGRCDQLRLCLPITLALHHPQCPKRGQEDSE